MTDTIGWGILATGGIAATFTRDLGLLPEAHVAAVGSRTEEAARSFAERFDIERAYGDWDGLIGDDNVDIVYVANTHNGHYEAARRALEAGKAVLCEKPLTVNLDQAQSLVDLARERGVFLMEAMWMRCNPAIRHLQTAVETGQIGEVTTLTADIGWAGPFPPDSRMRDPLQAGGALLDMGVYPLHLAHLILGAPSSVRVAATLLPEGVDASCAMVLGYERAVANLTASLESYVPVTAAISGTGGRIELDGPFYRPAGYRLCRPDGGEETFEVEYVGHGMTHEAVEAMRCLREGLIESPLVPWESTITIMSIMDAIRDHIGVRYPGE